MINTPMLLAKRYRVVCMINLHHGYIKPPCLLQSTILLQQVCLTVRILDAGCLLVFVDIIWW